MRTRSQAHRLSTALLAALFLLGAARAGATLTPRVAHSSTLMPTGNILIAGGMNDVGTILNTTELVLSASGTTYIDGPVMAVARASHTATVMANGKVLIAGGVDGGGNALATAEVYDPATNTFSGQIGGLTARYNHTATLLNGGSVLLCGGMATGGGVLSSCDYFTPTGAVVPGGAACGTAGGCINAAPSLLFARALHTATLLKDGKVWFAGGFNPAAAATNGYLTTTEKFDPAGNGGAGSIGTAASLAQARGLHTATMMGDGKVLIAGGYNIKNLKENLGILDTLEIYDPIANSMAPASPMKTRRMMLTATLSADGAVEFFGGLGNITTTYITAPTISGGSGADLTDTFSGVMSTGNSTTGTVGLSEPDGMFLGTPVVGQIVDGSVVYSSPSIDFGSGIAYFTPGDPHNPATGLQADLTGVTVGCKLPSGVLDNNCGYIDPSVVLPLKNLSQGKLYFKPLTGLAAQNGTVTGGTLHFTGTLSQLNSPLDLVNGTSIQAQITIPMPTELAGGTISSGTLTYTGGSYTAVSSYTVTLTGGDEVTIPNGTPINLVGGSAQITFTALLSNVQGTLAWDGSTTTYTASGGQDQPPAGAPSPSFALTGVGVNYVASQVSVDGKSFTIDVATVVIRKMIFGSPEFYNPSANEDLLTQPGGGVLGVDPAKARFGHTEVLMPNNDTEYFGGYRCSAPGFGTCGSLIAQTQGGGGKRDDFPYIYSYDNSANAGTLSTARALHTATLLPDGNILVAGGSYGPGILDTAEIYNPTTGKAAATIGKMRDTRDMHSATLLPNGRVLIAGGFTTNSTSSDSTKNAEIYYPDTQVFVRTAPMATPRYGHTATLLPNGNVLVIGGTTLGGAITSTAEIYRSTTSDWVAAAPLPGGARTQFTATLLKDGRVLVVGGIGVDLPVTSVYAYNPATDSWSGLLAALPRALYQHTATLLFDGRVMIAGGNDGLGEYNGASFIYDPVANSWLQTASSPLLEPRFGHSATLLPNGGVMIAGGSSQSGVIPTEIENYHISASSWAAGGIHFKDGAREFQTMTLAPDGYVYALGGSDGAIGGVGTTLVSAVDRSYFTASPDQYTKNAPPSARQAVILSTGSSGPGPLVQPGAAFTVTGIQFRGGTEASGGGAAAANSSFSYPHLILQRVDSSGGGGPQSDSGFVVDLTTAIYANSGNLSTLDSSITVTIPATSASIPAGWYAARVGANDVYSNGFFVQSGPSKPLLPPTSATGTVLGVSSVSWTWSTVAGVDGYNVYQATSGVFLGTAPAVAVPTFVETGLESGAETSVKIAGFTLSGDGPAIMASSVTTVVIPQVGTVVGTALNTTSIVWNWLGGKGVLYYNVYNSTTGVVIATPTANTFTDSNLEVNSRRSIRVSAVVPGAEGPLSEGATAYTWANTPAPASPFLLSLSTGSYLVKWLINGNPNGTTYYVRIVGVDGSSATLTTQTLSAGITGFSPSVPLFPGSPYDTQIGAVNGDGIDTAPLDLGTTYTLTTTPTGLTVIDNTPVSLTVQWDTTANSTFTTYQVTYSSDNFVADISTALAFSAAFNGSQANIPGLRTSTTYWIRVQASNPFGQLSAFSGSISTITNNGGAASGSLAGPLLAAANSELAGYLSDGRYVQLDSPRGAFPTDTIATLTPFNVVAGSTLCPNGFNVAVTITMNPALQPVAPVYFTADYDPASIGVVPTSRITLARYVDIGVCTPLDTTFLAGSSRPQFRAQLNHFSTYQLVQIPLETSAANARIFPNPYRASRDGYVTFDSMPPYSRVRIMTLQGETLLDERANSYGLLTWGGTNGGGRVAASGLYIVVVESGGSKKIQKLAVIR